MSDESVGVVAEFRVRADRVDDFAERAFHTLVEPTRREEGCLAYDLWQDTGDPTRFVMVERWTSAAALQKHLAQPNLQAAVAELRPLGEGEITVHQYRPVGGHR